MGLFRKKETTHFERDESGKVVKVTRNGQDVDREVNRMKSARELEQEYYKKHPERKHPTLKRVGRGLEKVDKKIVKYNRSRNIMNPKRRTTGYSTRDNYNPFGSLFDTGIKPAKAPRKSKSQKYTIVGGKAYPIVGSSGKKKSKKPRSKSSGGYDIFDNWGLMK